MEFFVVLWLGFAAYGFYVIGKLALKDPKRTTSTASFFWRLITKK